MSAARGGLVVCWLAACGGGGGSRASAPPTHAAAAPPTTPSGAASSPSAEAPGSSPRFPRMHLVADDLSADEGARYTYDLDGDGAFVSDNWMSNGGSTSTVWRCHGRIAADHAAPWLARLDAEATLAVAPPGPRNARELGLAYEFELGYARAPGEMTYADPSALNTPLTDLVVRLNAAQTCNFSSE